MLNVLVLSVYAKVFMLNVLMLSIYAESPNVECLS
jgi:hypothetical protein